MSLWQRLWRRETPPPKSGVIPVEDSRERAVQRMPPRILPKEWPAPRPGTLAGGGIGGCIDAFGHEFLYRECIRQPHQNVFVSPLSVFLALAMAESGAGGATKAAMRRALRLPADASDAEVRDAASAILKKMRPRGEAELSIANALWVAENSGITPEFIAGCEEAFDAAIRTLDLSQPSAAGDINKWVAEKTKGKIPQIVTPGDIREAPAVITNAVYFRAKFVNKFRKELTRPEPFFLANGLQKQVPMMLRDGISRAYFSGSRFEAAALPYRDSNMVLYVVLPKKGTTPEEALANDLAANDALTSPKDLAEEPLLNLRIPRFTLDFESPLRTSLAQMGMGIAFEYPGADFTPMGSKEFMIGEVVHKTRLEVDEEGTVAAAATALTVTGCVIPRREPKVVTLVVDRPFAIVLRDVVARTTIFSGVVYEP